ncbi:MAG TPA: DUF3810 family protein, partial [Terriglobia bacterium]|nr:DUF3810 family protein [Terriglobia bacterium]
MVKTKTGILQNFTVSVGKSRAWIFPGFALLTFIFSWIGIYPSNVIERWYARRFFPAVSFLAGRFADSVSFAWLDPTIIVVVVLLVLLIRKRRWAALANLIAIMYLILFWFWGLNYHRQPLAAKLATDASKTRPEAMAEFARRAALELNRLYLIRQNQIYDESQTRKEAADRVRRVVSIIDGTNWEAAHRIKISVLADPWMHAAGIDGVFNPFAHEPVISNTILDVEKPFIISHELAHVRGYPDEGDANVIAVFATLMSDDTGFQYSGWLSLWPYLRTRDLGQLLDAGPRHDLQRILDRDRAEEI